MKRLASLLIVTAFAAGSAVAAETTPANAGNGFYGGVALRDSGTESRGVSVGTMASAWTRFTTPAADDTGARTLLYGGYKWSNDLAVEAAFEANDRYTLRRTDALGRSGVGLALPGFSDTPARSWNVDVYGSWSFNRNVSLYGRLGYAQADAAPTLAGLSSTDPRRARDGVNYGVGLRYDVTSAFGLKVEYARFARFPGELIGSALPDSDQVQLGLQYRF